MNLVWRIGVRGSESVWDYSTRSDWSEPSLLFEICQTPLTGGHRWHTRPDRWPLFTRHVRPWCGGRERRKPCLRWERSARRSPGRYRSFCNRWWKENIDPEHGRSLGKEDDRDDCCGLRLLYTMCKRSACGTQCCWAVLFNIIPDPFWPQEMKSVCLSVS